MITDLEIEELKEMQVHPVIVAKIRHLRTREADLTTALSDVLRAMRIWGDMEDGIPPYDESGTRIRPAYDRAKALLDAAERGRGT